MSLVQQRQINLLKERVDALEKQSRQQGRELAEANRQLDLLLNQFEKRMAKAIDKVIADGIVAEQSTDSQIRDLIGGKNDFSS